MSHTNPNENPHHSSVGALTLAALGVVYGDIGTSPLYALKECFNPQHGLPLTQATVLGVLSLLFWTVTLVVSIKYVLIVLRADNRGEGGILALLAMTLAGTPSHSPLRARLVLLGLVGAAMFYGDSILTPAISVLSAVEGLELATPALKPYVIPITLGILTALFAIQKFGTARIGRWFGPITVVWFVALAGFGIAAISRNPEVLAALSPHYAVQLAWSAPMLTFILMGSVFLAVTGGEALYADMGHFGAKPIRYAWYGLVMPALLLNYFGQGALVLTDPAAIKNPFYLLVPAAWLLPMVALATAATVIASQAVISGAFSMTAQAIKLGFAPRMNITHTSAAQMGQIYIPLINWALFLGVAGLVLGFQTSSSLAAAYGLAVAATMVITTVLCTLVAHRRWQWSRGKTALVFAPLLALEVILFSANFLKILDGGWFPIVAATLICILLFTWKRGRELVGTQTAATALPLQPFLESLALSAPHRVEGNAIFLTANPEDVPHALLHNLKHNRVLHTTNVLLTVSTHETPRVSPAECMLVTPLGHGFWRVVMRVGFMDEANIPQALAKLPNEQAAGLPHLDLMLTSYFLARESVVPSDLPGMAKWREVLFAWMSRNALSATDFFKLPPNRIVELGAQVAI